jgi:hypothetical protein
MIPDVHPGSRIRILIFYPSRVPDPGVKKAERRVKTETRERVNPSSKEKRSLL